MASVPSSTSQYVRLAQKLPAPLLRFLARWPPASLQPAGAPKTHFQEQRPDPFSPYKHPKTGKWLDPVYSARRQANLVKMARMNGVEELLPETRKGTYTRLAYRVEHGLRVKGTGVGQKVKGHAYERHMIANMEKKRKAMLAMPGLIKAWKKKPRNPPSKVLHKRHDIQIPQPTHAPAAQTAIKPLSHTNPRIPSTAPLGLSAMTAPQTHYTILGLTPSLLNSSHQKGPSPSALLKKAYHRALLRHHPDKQAPSSSTCLPSSPSSSSTPLSSCTAQDTTASTSGVYTIDQIATAFAVLSSPAQRASYDAELRQRSPAVGSARPEFQTGVENVDLDDLPFEGGTERWYRACRCGNERGYLFSEEDLGEVEDEGVLVLGCQDCSLWLRVHFAVVNEDADLAYEDEAAKDNG
ncbi:hypothetical protein E4U12_002764 [Claviceps purpurea]|nr:hypothetical protein E4U12_002764 [Claviceps purpurea]